MLISLMLFVKSLLRALVTPKDVAYVRLSPNRKGAIYFYSKLSKRMFRLQSRGVSDSRVADQVFTNHDYEILSGSSSFDDQLQSIIRSGKTPLIIDCGAHIGLSAMYFAERFPAAKVVAIEPSAANIKIAQGHCAKLPNVELIHAAIGSKPGFVHIINPEAEAWALQTERSATATDTRVVTIAEIVAAHPDTALTIVKVDIEGFEADLFESNLQWIDSCPLIIIELHDWLMPNQASSKNFLKAISGRNRDFVYRGENVFSLRNNAKRNKKPTKL